MKNVFYKIWNYSPSQIINIFRNKIWLPKYLPKFNIDYKELEKLKNMPRYEKGETVLFGKKLYFSDARSYLEMCDEIFKEENYKFISDKNAPFILDCGSNIGISIIFFKLLYPNSRIIAFEPDPDIFSILKKNIKSFNFENVELHNKAVWSSNEKVNFFSEGSWGGRISQNSSNKKLISVESVKLSEFLNEKIDFLKIDIEGAEARVIDDCHDKLYNVKNLFIEYHSSVEEDQTLDKILSLISKSGMRYYIEGASHRKHPFLERIVSGFDLQLNISAYRDNN